MLDQALEVFWRLGYEGATVADLTGATGLTATSLYAAFDSKEGLYRRVLAHYREGPGAGTFLALKEEPTARAAFARVLREAARNFTRRKHPPGCMVSTAVLRCAETHRPVAEFVTSLRLSSVALFRERLVQAVKDGELSAGTDPGVLARYFGTLLQGMSVQAADGATEDDLLALAELAMRAWDGGDARPRAKESS
ncbi:TetR family transcriptional regulator [Myxococcus stipitatus DSM 14675]|uniref:TetR family transcriptional regulator n=1 Tax=Myxococcus stipitatus (strain DSM 14675 / JCM 12634 / Mx s8) TaxID=1278073 RepID=L7ULC7_MYXSD|nr:TetR family transcriptional regulator [Myxococcus stipitatus DSM 14675]